MTQAAACKVCGYPVVAAPERLLEPERRTQSFPKRPR
jgi:hypothetical protein